MRAVPGSPKVTICYVLRNDEGLPRRSNQNAIPANNRPYNPKAFYKPGRTKTREGPHQVHQVHCRHWVMFGSQKVGCMANIGHPADVDCGKVSRRSTPL
jgi:hypothetical protein